MLHRSLCPSDDYTMACQVHLVEVTAIRESGVHVNGSVDVENIYLPNHLEMVTPTKTKSS